jgi:hypothetical protein
MKKREWKTIRDGDKDEGKEKKGREIEGRKKIELLIGMERKEGLEKFG